MPRSRPTSPARADLRVQLSERWGIGVGNCCIDTDYDRGAGTERKLWSMMNKGTYLGVQIGW